MRRALVVLAAALACASDPEPAAPGGAAAGRPRVIVELAADDRGDAAASLVRLLHHADEIEVRGILVADARRDLPAVRRLLAAYARALPSLRRRSPGFPSAAELEARVAGSPDAARLVVAALEEPDVLWVLRWSAPPLPSALPHALDELQARSEAGSQAISMDGRYRDALARLRLVGPTSDLGGHKRLLGLVVEMDGGPSGFAARAAEALATSGARLAGDGNPLWAERDPAARDAGAIAFLHLLPRGLGRPERPGWGGWSGRFAPHGNGWPAWWETSAEDRWGADPSPIASVARWARAAQEDYATRLGWGRAGRQNRAPEVVVNGAAGLDPVWINAGPGDDVRLTADGTIDPDGGPVHLRWIPYPEPGTYPNAFPTSVKDGPWLTVAMPFDFSEGRTFHLVLEARDDADPPLTRYRRVILRHGASSP